MNENGNFGGRRWGKEGKEGRAEIRFKQGFLYKNSFHGIIIC